MGLFSKKKNGDYFVEMIQSLSEIKSDSKYFRSDLEDIKENHKEHIAAEYERRKIDRDWQKEIDIKFAKKIECPESGKIGVIEKDVKDLKSGKELTKGKFLGMKLIWVILLGVLGLAMLVLNIMWKLGLL